MKKTLLLLGILFLSSLSFAQISKQQAINLVMDSIVNRDTTNEKANSSGTVNMDDNIPPVSNLTSYVSDNDTVFLSWSIPSEAEEAVISWSNMIDHGDWGVAAGQCATDQAARFDTDDLADFVGWRIKDVSVILSYSDTMSGMQDQNYYIRIWKGTNNELEQIYEKEIIQPVDRLLH